MSGCSAEGPTEAESSTRPELGVSTASLADSDVAYMRYTVERCGGGPVETSVREIGSTSLPAGLDAFEKKPFDPSSEHEFTDSYFYLDSGCYHVRVEPLRKNKKPSKKCRPGAKKKLKVRDGKTLETLIIVQCKGARRGGMDVVSAINHEPEIRDLTFDPSKIVTCPRRVEICMTARDPDDDPMRADFDIRKGPTPIGAPSYSKPIDKNGHIKKCVSFRPGHGQWKLRFRVWDRVWHEGQKLDVEDYLAKVQDEKRRSRDKLTFPLYGSRCEDGLDAGVPADIADAVTPLDGGDAAPPELDVAPVRDVPATPDARDVSPPEDAPEQPDTRDAAPPEDAPEQPDTRDAAPPEHAPEQPDARDAAPPEDAPEQPDVLEDALEPDTGEAQYCSQTQGGYGAACQGGNPGCVRDSLFPGDFPNGLLIGDQDGPDADGFFAARFDSASAIQAFLPAGGMSGTLTSDEVDPTSTSAGVFAGQLVAAKLSIAFSDDRTGNEVAPLIYSSTCAGGNPFAGDSLAEIVQTCDAVVSGESNAATPVECSEALDDFNNAFVDCKKSSGCFLKPAEL